MPSDQMDFNEKAYMLRIAPGILSRKPGAQVSSMSLPMSVSKPDARIGHSLAWMTAMS